VACRLLLTNATSGKRILPVHYNDNYFSLAPGDTQTVEIKFDDSDKGDGNPKLSISGINVAEQFVTIGPVSSRRGIVEIGPYKGIYARFSGKNMRISNTGRGTGWNLTLFDMSGRSVVRKNGLGTSDVTFVSVAGLSPGTYLAMVKSGGESYRALMTIAEH
jgi:hypothetical protein